MNNFDMFYFVATPTLEGSLIWQDLSSFGKHEEPGVSISFNLSGRVGKRKAIKFVSRLTVEKDLSFIRYLGNEKWRIDFDLAKKFFRDSDFSAVDWAHSSLVCRPEIEVHVRDGSDQEDTSLYFVFSKEDIQLMIDQKIFMSHKGANKPLVRDTATVLRTLGFQPWLDEDAMQAGANLERSLLEGMKQSCAAVFFITPEYVDENYLATEIDYAVSQKRAKQDRFSIITIVVKDKSGNKGVVPELLKPFVWKEPENDLRMLDEIIKALPIRLEGPVWK